jgi:chromosome segregation ATPase
MDESANINWFLALLVGAQFILNIAIVALSRRGQVADTYESLSVTVNNLSTEVKRLRIDLEIERRAREIAEKAMRLLQKKFDTLEAKYNALSANYTAVVFENDALKDALDYQSDEED